MNVSEITIHFDHAGKPTTSYVISTGFCGAGTVTFGDPLAYVQALQKTATEMREFLTGSASHRLATGEVLRG